MEANEGGIEFRHWLGRKKKAIPFLIGFHGKEELWVPRES